ncbi:hypothetical protein GCM10010301_73410 [Streptomyces plicatus]|nr:hypothetical protein GCM10010301_73410 [Streptomyces plicatus]
MMSCVLDGRCDTGSSLPSDECGETDEYDLRGSSFPSIVRFPAATVFSMGGPRHNIPRYPTRVNVPYCIRLDIMFILILYAYLA